MKKFLKFLLIILFLLGLTYGKEYFLKDVRILYNILPSGEIEVISNITYIFSGSFSRAWITIPKGKYKIRDISVGEIINGRLIYYTYHPETLERISNTFDATYDQKQYKITWFYRATDEQKTFIIIYKLEGVLKVYEDVAEFYWKVWGEDWDLSLPALWVEVNLPSEIKSIGDVNYWLHPKIEGKIGIRKDYKAIIAYAGRIPSHQWVEVRVVFPRSYLTQFNPFKVELVSKKGRDLILAEEERWRREEEQKAKLVNNLERIFLFLYLALILLGILLPFGIYLKFGREPKVEYYRKYEQEPPEDISPAWVEMLINQSRELSNKSIVASTLELARRGYIKIQEELKKGFLERGQKEYKIVINNKEVEKDLSKDLKLLLDEFKKFGSEFYISELRNYVYKKKKWINEKGRSKINDLNLIWILLGIIYIPIFILFKILREELLAFSLGFWYLLVLNILISLIFIKLAQRYSKEGKILALRWKALRRYLKDFSLISQHPPSSLILWEKYLIYGTALGVAKNVLKTIQMLNVPINEVSWYVPVYNESFSNFANSLQNFRSSLDSFSSAFSSSIYFSTASSSSDGGGGGAD